MLTNASVKAAQPRARAFKLHDSGGLHLIVRPTGSKTFRMKFRRGCKEQLLTFGSWPDVSLTDARARRDLARDQLERGANPGSARGSPQLETFEQLARRWHERRRPRWSPEHAADVLASLERNVFPAIGGIAPRAIDAQTVLEVLLQVERSGCIETARRLRERISGVFRLGIPLQICNSDPAALISDELSPRPVQRPQPALVDLTEAVKLLHQVDSLEGPPIAKLASRFLALTVPRMASLRWALRSELEDLDGQAPIWRIPAQRMKLTKVRKSDPAGEHAIPLSRQAVVVARQLLELAGDSTLLFPGRRRGRPIGEGAIGELYAAAGYGGRHVPHGWRATFSTILNDLFPDDRGLIDQALAHVAHKGRVEGAYNRAQHQERMRDLFQRWADLLDPQDSRRETER